MNDFYQLLFNYVAFPVFVIDKNGLVTYKNLSSKKYHPHIRCRTKLQRHLKLETDSRLLVLAGDSPFSIGIRLAYRDEEICLFLSRFQKPDGRKILFAMREAFGEDAIRFLSGLKSAVCTMSMDRTYADLLLITEWESADLGIGTYAPDILLSPFFKRLSRFSVLGYRMDTEVDDTYRARRTICTSPHELLHRVSHMTYLMMKLSLSKTITIRLSTDMDAGCHNLSMQTKTALCSVTHEGEEIAAFIPECEAEMRLLSTFSAVGETLRLTADEKGFTTLVCTIPCESTPKALSLHNHSTFFDITKFAEDFADKLFKKFVS